ncbi:OLC1v1036506C1 [Oldenlandia corymbosa var. corymbosa]|uniref:OLC1v1036506C1 n=1 Tax=Oldenlandia corymbosa var. corymbosa TaxID=529605 RepID=A0AAV1CW20_OLDCO|nr:OLC1v1036506C1 [Oldenlandia corymbosa var. corymbosa]
MTKYFSPLCILMIIWCIWAPISTASYDGTTYSSFASTECKRHPEEPLYDGGLLMDKETQYTWVNGSNLVLSPSFALQNLTKDTYYCFSAWVKTNDTSLTLIRASLTTEIETLNCTGTVLAQKGCWSFLKGGFMLNYTSNSPLLYFQNPQGKNINVQIANPALEPFSKEQWRLDQEYKINKGRKREVIIHVSNKNGLKLKGADVTVRQKSRDFPFGSAISASIIGNLPYQKWFTERFNAAVFENELK